MPKRHVWIVDFAPSHVEQWTFYIFSSDREFHSGNAGRPVRA